jgi:hypothetical protein
MVSVGDRITRDSGSDTNPESRHTVRRAVRTESGSPPLEGGGVWDWSRPNVCSRSGTCVEGGSAPSAPPVPAIPRAATLQECGRQLQLPGNSEVPNQGRRHRQSRNQGVEGSGREQASLYLLNSPRLWSIRVRDQGEKKSLRMGFSGLRRSRFHSSCQQFLPLSVLFDSLLQHQHSRQVC